MNTKTSIQHVAILLGIGLLSALPQDVHSSSWDPSLIVNTESFQTLDEGDGTTDIELQFGDALGEIIEFNRTDDRFEFSNDVFINGHLTGSALSVTGLNNCDTIDTDANGNLVCGTDATGSGSGVGGGTGAYISVTTNENSTTGSTSPWDIFEDTNYTGTLDYTTNASDNVTFTSSNGRFTVDENGTYLITLNIILTSVSSDLTDYIVLKNGSAIYQDDFFVHSVVDPPERTITLVQELVAGDYIEFQIDPLGGSSDAVQSGTTASFAILGRNGGEDGGISGSEAVAQFIQRQGDTMTGVLTLNMDSNSGALLIDSEATTQPGISIDIAGDSNSPHLLFGEGGTFDVNLFRDAADVLRTSDTFKIDGDFTVDGTAIFNADGDADNFRVETDNDANTLFVHGASDQVGIGESTPEAKLDVAGSFSGTILTVSNLKSCDTVKSSADGTLLCGPSSSGAILAQYSDTSGGAARQDLNVAAPVAVSWENEIREDAGFTHDPVVNNSRVAIDDAGWYRISYSVSHENGGGSRKTIRCRIRMNGSTYVDYSTSYAYSRDTTDEWATNTASAFVQTTSANEYYEIMCNGEGSTIGTQTALTVQNASWTFAELPGASGGTGGSASLDGAYDNDAGERTIAVDNGDVSWDLSGAHDFIIDLQGAGNVGIDTATPTADLHVVGDTSTTNLAVTGLADCDKVVTDATGTLTCASSTGSGSYASITVDENASGTAADHDIFEDANYPSTLDYIENGSQNVTFTPNNGRFTVTETGSYVIALNLILLQPGFSGLQNVVSIKVNGTNVYSYDFYIHSSVDPPERTFSIIQGLNAGDYVEFHIDGPVSVNVQDGTTANIFSLAGGGGGASGNADTFDTAYDNDTGERTIVIDDGDVSWDMSGAHNFIIDLQGTGNVGIGTSSPDADLEVAGTLSGSLVNDRGSNPTVACSAAESGRQWADTDTGMLYICDTSNGRNKWLTPYETVIFGDEGGACPAGQDPNSNNNCNVDWGNGLGTDNSTDLGFYIPHDITITGYGFSEDNDACTTGTFDLEVWSTGSFADDNTYTFEANVATGLTGEAHNSNALNVDVAGSQYILWGLDNNCGQAIDDWNAVLYFRNRHD